MRASIVIPVWNGALVICDCLKALYTHSSEERLLEVVCIDNGSPDDSATLIAEHYPQTRLIRQPVNLGFAGGVNAGIDAAQGDCFVLLNQDCLVQPGWLSALLQALEAHPEFGIAGCTILDPDGKVSHTGARIRRPDARSEHLVNTVEGDGPQRVEYVTGAAFAIRRETWQAVGRFDEGYYPAYYEESDYCYRARHQGIETAYVPQARVTHLSSNRQWQLDPIQHAANQHRARYRFVCKHFDSQELESFFAAEKTALTIEDYFEQALAHTKAARDTIRSLPDILERRRFDLDSTVSPAHRRQLQVGFTEIMRMSFSTAERLIPTWPVDASLRLDEDWRAIKRRSEELRQQELDLLERIYFRSPTDSRPESALHRLFRLAVLRPLSFLIGRDYLLLSELNTVHAARMSKIEDHLEAFQNRICQRLALLETLIDYDYR
jgi:GT2 family glycosyltransferase